MKKTLALLLVLWLGLICPCAGIASEDITGLTLPNPEALNQSRQTIMLLVDPATKKIVFANQTAISFYGYSLEQFQGKTMEDLTAGSSSGAQEATGQTQIVIHKLSDGETKKVEVRPFNVLVGGQSRVLYLVADASARPSAWTYPLVVAGGIVLLALLFIVRILNKSRQAWNTAKAVGSEKDVLRKTFIDADDSLIYLKDENLRYVFVNKAFEKFYGKTEAQVIGWDDFALSDEEFARMRRHSDLKALETDGVVSDELEWDGRYFRTLKFPVVLPNGKTGVGAYITDITAARKNEKKHEKALIRHKIMADMLSRSFQSKQEQLDYVLHEALKLTESQFGYLYLYDEQKRTFNLSSWTRGVTEACDVEKQQTEYSLEHTGIWGEVVRQRKPLVVNDFGAPNPLRKGFPEGHVHIDRFMSAPVVIDEKIVAVIGMANKPAEYDDNDVYETILLMGGVWNTLSRRESQDTLSAERNKFQQTLLSIGDGVMVVDKDGLVEMLNPVAEELTGWPQAQARGKHYTEVFALSHEVPGETIQDPIKAVQETGTVQEIENHAVLTSRDGQAYFLEDSAAPIRNEAGEIAGTVLVFRDVTGKRKQQKEIEYLSFHDSLTGLYNRRFFEEELRRLDTKRNLPISIIVGDVNGLKLTNDVFGHSCGDLLLERFAQVLRRVCRADDIIARWGGDEYALLLPKTSLRGAEQVIRRIREEFAKEQVRSVKGNVSMGAFTKEGPEESLQETVNQAEENMYTAKILEHGQMMKTTLDTIMGILRESSPREGEHALHVSRLCQAMGEKLSMAEDEIKRLKDAGYLHDIGKITLDPKLLGCPTDMTSQEWAEVRKHPVTGFRILNAFDDMLDLAQIVLAHQERWDGSGYPKGLKGEEIPRAARIIALAESYERRVYGEGCTKEQALEAIITRKGTHFDPALTDAFVVMMMDKDPEKNEK